MNFGSHISETFFIRKLFQSARLYILGIVRKLASKCAWQIIRFWYHSYERMLVELELSIENMDFKVDGSSIYTTIERIKLNLFNILMILNKWIIRWFTFDVTTRSLTTQSPFLSIIIIRLSGHAQTFHDSSFSVMSFPHYISTIDLTLFLQLLDEISSTNVVYLGLQQQQPPQSKCFSITRVSQPNWSHPLTASPSPSTDCYFK